MSTRTVKVPNISCGHCVKTIEREVGELEGVTSVTASQSEKDVTVEWDEARTSWDSIEETMEEINYPPRLD